MAMLKGSFLNKIKAM